MATPAEAAARRLTLLAAIVRDRAHHSQPWLIDRLADLLQDAAATAPATPLENGRRLPAATLDTLQQALDLMGEQDFHLSASVLEYAVAPTLGSVPPMHPLNAVTEELALQDFDLQARRDTVLHDRHLDSDDDAMVTWALRTLALLHYRHERLAATVALDNARPCNQGKPPYHLTVRQHAAHKAAIHAGPTDGAKLIAALAVFRIPAFFTEDRGASAVLVAADGTHDEDEAHAGPRVLLHSGERADLPPERHAQPWTAALYDKGGERVKQLFTAPAGLTLDAECAHAALCLAVWLASHAEDAPPA
ncbi:hypothetical protein ABZ543_08235 [Streptomyces roseifaciens]